MNETLPLNVVVYCKWSLFVNNCVDSSYFVSTFYASIALSALVISLSGALLIHRIRVYRDVELFSNGLFAPLEGFLGFTVVSTIMRTVCSIIFLTDTLPSNYALRAVIEDSKWVIGEFAVITHLAGVFHAIPRVTFFQPTSAISNFWIPSNHFTKTSYWFLMIFQYVVAQGSSFLYGFFYMRNNNTLTNVFIATRLLSYSIVNITLALGYGIYGRLLVKLAKKSFELVQGKGGIVEDFGDTTMESTIREEEDGREILAKKRIYILNKEKNRSDVRLRNNRFKWYLRKMQIFNISAITTLSFWSVLSFILAFQQQEIWRFLPMSKFHAFVANIATECVYLVVLVGVLLSEMRPNEDSSPFDTLINSNQFTQSTSV